jgi:hypothetical protein
VVAADDAAKPKEMPPGRVGEARVCYNCWMTKEQVKTILDRVLTWPPERQADVAQVVTLMEEQDKSTLRLSDEQVAEVKRGLLTQTRNF